MCGSRGRVSLPLASCSAPLLVILDRDDKEDQQGEALDPCQEEKVVVQRAVIDVTWKERENKDIIGIVCVTPSLRLQTAEKQHWRLDTT